MCVRVCVEGDLIFDTIPSQEENKYRHKDPEPKVYPCFIQELLVNNLLIYSLTYGVSFDSLSKRDWKSSTQIVSANL